MKDYYKVLKIPRTASAAEIRRAFIDLMRIYHPDIAGDSPEVKRKIDEIIEAYSVLGNLDSRLKYSVLLNRSIKVPKLMDAEIKFNTANQKKLK